MKIGDRVTMHGCGEATFDKNKDRVFVVASVPRDLCGSEVVSIDYEDTGGRAYTSFATEFLCALNNDDPNNHPTGCSCCACCDDK